MRAWLGTRYARLAARGVPGVVGRLPGDGSGARRLCLTFDDGPTPQGTAALLARLDRHAIRAMFFLVGRNAERCPQLVRDLLAAGHVIGNHSQTHLDAWKRPAAEVAADFARGSAVLEEIGGAPLAWMRPPYGRLTPGVLRWSRAAGQRVMLWDAMPPDFEPGRTAAEVSRTLERSVRPGSIVVLHDNPQAAGVTPQALDESLPRLLDAGWRFVLPEPSAGTEGRSEEARTENGASSQQSGVAPVGASPTGAAPAARG